MTALLQRNSSRIRGIKDEAADCVLVSSDGWRLLFMAATSCQPGESDQVLFSSAHLLRGLKEL